MLKSYDKVLDNAAWIKQATIYKETTVTTKAKIFYFHGGGLLYGFRKDGYFMRYRIYFSKSSLSDLNINNNNKTDTEII